MVSVMGSQVWSGWVTSKVASALDSSRPALRYDRCMDHDAQDMTTTPPEPAPAGPRIALFGLGTVGTAVAERLLDEEWRAAVAARGHRAPTLVGIADLDLETDRGLTIPPEVRQTTDYTELLEADDVDVVVELMGGSGVAGEAVLAAFKAGKSVVTANKDLLARRGRELEKASRETGAALRFEAAVMAGVPVLGPLVGELCSSRVDHIRGILNGTSNYILSTMAADARDYADVLAEAQARGYAEADPVSDVEGFDAAYKLVILCRLAYDGWLDVEAVRRSAPAVETVPANGITGVKRSHLSVAARLGLAIKLVARAEQLPEGTVRAAVTPMAVAAGSRLGSTNGVTNMVEFSADPAGRVSMTGPGAGGPATSGAILADVLALAHGAGSTWGLLPEAGDLAIEDDLAAERGWLVVIEGLGAAGFPDAVKELGLATTDEGLVSKPISLTALTTRLGFLDRPVTVYPILSDA
jgi:homoserine dehydrogenase